MFIKNGDDPKTKILRVIEAEEMDTPLEDLLKKDKKALEMTTTNLKTEDK